jgi:methanogenic corrinoid protein MtbC1
MSASETATKSQHPIQVAARRSGLTADVIRAWERRHRAVNPGRSGTNRRLYSDEDVERLLLLGQVTRAGRRIGDVAGLSLEALRSMVAEDREATARLGKSPKQEGRGSPVARHLEVCLDAIERLDASMLETALAQASIDLPTPALLGRLLLPLLDEVGRRWRDGSFRVAHEHVATSIIRSFLGSRENGASDGQSAPEIIVATPAGQRHELGGLAVSAIAATDGWRVTYLGPDLPAEEIAAAALQRKASAVALSIVYPADDPLLARELKTLRSRLGDTVRLIVGGASAAAYAEPLRAVGARLLPDLSSLREELQSLRFGPPAS